MNVVRKWKRLMAVGCTHGVHIDPAYRKATLEFRERWKPQTVFHLGDWCDTTALRAGAKNNADSSEPIRPDIDVGLQYLRELGVTHCTMGNHDERPYRFLNDPNAMVRELSEMLVEGIEREMKRAKIQWLNTWSNYQFFQLGGYKWMHGYMFNETAARDHAEAHGNVVFAHTHTTQFAKGRRDDSPTGICVGTGTKFGNLDYAKTRRKTLSWSQGFVWGEYYDDRAVLWLHEQPRTETEWRLPV